MLPTLDFTVVICAYTEDRWLELTTALASLRAQTAPARELIVVIDHNPRLLERAQAAFPEAQVIANQHGRGLSGARNTGVLAARGEIIAFMDEDARADPDWLAQLARGYTRPEILGVGGEIEPGWQAGRPAWFPPEFDWVVGCTYRGMPATAAGVRNLIGCNMSVRRAVIEAVGGFREGLGRIGTTPLGCEETELCIRAQQHWPAGQFLYDPQARVQHSVPASRAQWSYFLARCWAEGRSKALVARWVGQADALAAEQAYTRRTLPAGVLAGVKALVLRGEAAGAQRAGAILAGLAVTTLGYVSGWVVVAAGARQPARAAPHAAGGS